MLATGYFVKTPACSQQFFSQVFIIASQNFYFFSNFKVSLKKLEISARGRL